MAGENSPYLQFKPGSFFGGKRIDARPRNVEYEEGTGPGTGRTARRVDPGMGGGLDSHFLAQRYKDMPMSQISSFANTMRGRGMMYNPYAGTYQNDSMYNRSGAGYGREPQGPQTEPQMQWAQKAQEKQSGAGALGKVGEKMASMNPPTGGMMGSLGWLPKIAQAATSGGFFGGSNPYAQPQMPTKSPEVVAKEIGDEKTMMDQFRRGVNYTTRDGTTSFTSPYGRGKMTTYADPAKKPQSMVKDDFGRMVPMSDYLSDKKKVQASKGMI